MGLGKLFEKTLKGTLGQKKAQGQITQLKKEYLRLWNIGQLKTLCHQKGIATVKQEVNPGLGQQTVKATPINFYDLVDLVSKTINSKEIIYFARQNEIDFSSFETKLNEIKAFYNMV